MPTVYSSAEFPSRVYGDSYTPELSRDLYAVSREGLTLDQWTALMARCCPHGYNDFNVASVAVFLKTWADKITLHPAREGSVAVYIRGPNRAVIQIAQALIEDRAGPRRIAADEVDLATLPDGTGRASLRVWWD